MHTARYYHAFSAFPAHPSIDSLHDESPLLFEVEVAIAAQAKVREFVLDEVVLELRNGQRIPAAGALPLKLVRRVVVADNSASAKEGGGSVTIGNDDVADSAAASPIVSSGSGGGGGSRTGASPQEKEIASSSNGGGAVVVHLCPGESIVVHAHFSIPAPSHARCVKTMFRPLEGTTRVLCPSSKMTKGGQSTQQYFYFIKKWAAAATLYIIHPLLCMLGLVCESMLTCAIPTTANYTFQVRKSTFKKM